MIAVLRRLYKSQQAATLIEYSLIVCLIAGVAIGQKVLNMLGPMGNALG